MKRILLLAILCIGTLGTLYAQESNGQKDIYARDSYLNKKLPKLNIEKWITEKPNTTGKFVLYEFWATFCGPCHKAIPMLNRCAKRFKNDLVIIGITEQTEKTVRTVKVPKMDFYIAIAPNGKNLDKLTIEGIPHTKLVSPEGVVIWEGCPVDPDYPLSEDIIEKLIKKYKKTSSK